MSKSSGPKSTAPQSTARPSSLRRTNVTRALRREYSLHRLDESHTPSNPHLFFASWFREATESGISEPNAMVLSTVSRQRHPSSRTVLMKEFGPQGIVFFTNYRSQKGLEIAGNRWVALLFLWKELERQVRIEGRAIRCSRAESEAYFATRPRPSQVSAAISPQSREISSREQLEQLFSIFSEQHAERPIRCPSHWGGYRVVPTKFEFWQGRRSRLHDRVCYHFRTGRWIKTRLAP